MQQAVKEGNGGGELACGLPPISRVTRKYWGGKRICPLGEKRPHRSGSARRSETATPAWPFCPVITLLSARRPRPLAQQRHGRKAPRRPGLQISSRCQIFDVGRPRAVSAGKEKVGEEEKKSSINNKIPSAEGAGPAPKSLIASCRPWKEGSSYRA